MLSPFRLLLCLLVRVMIATAIVAILLGRSARGPAAHLDAPRRELTIPRYRAFDGSLFPDHPRSPRLLDTETGAVIVLKIPGGERSDAISVSPWRDATGRLMLAGRWWGTVGDGTDRLPGSLGLARWTVPEGRSLDLIAIDPILVGPPCWSPARSDRILFAAGDGRLYLFDFPDGGEAEGARAAGRPRPVRWATTPAGLDSLHIRQPCWPSGPGLGGRLVAALHFRPRNPPPGPPPASQLWWLELGPDATAIVAAGRLIAPEPGAPETTDDELCPSVGAARDGGLMLAYLVAIGGRVPVELRTAPIACEGEMAGGVPRVRAGASRRLATVGLLGPPAFSPDGRWIYAAVRDGGSGEIRIRRFATAPDDPRDPTAERSLRPTPGCRERG